MAAVALAVSAAALAVALVRGPSAATGSEQAPGSEALAVAATSSSETGPAAEETPAGGEADSSGASAARGSPTAEAVYEATAGGVVEVSATGVSGDGATPFDPGGGEATGTGFVIDDEGHVVTNDHVVSGASSVSVSFPDGTQASARMVAADRSSDLALLQVDAPASELEPLALGSSGDLVVGQDVYALGTPYGLEGTFTAGIVSALDRTIQAPNGYTIDGAIQTDAAINSGNSGGPLLDAGGRVIGVTAQIESSNGGNVGIGYAIPIDLVKRVVSQLERGGAVAYAYLGVSVEPATVGDGHGAAIAEVRPGSPADEAGLRAGDVVTSADGDPVDSPEDITSAVGARQPGDELELTIVRDGSEQTITVTLGRRPDGTA